MKLSVSRWLFLALVGVALLPPLLWLVGAAGSAILPANTAETFLDPVARRLLSRSLTVAGLASGLALVLGSSFGWLTARYQVAGRRLALALSVLPLLLPPYCAALAWNLFLIPTGWFNTLAVRAGLLAEPWSPYGSAPMAACVLAFTYWPLVAWLVILVTRSVPPELEETARLHLAPGTAARWAAVPALRAALPVGGLLVFLLALADFGVPNTLGVPTYPVELVRQFQESRDPGVVSRLSGPLLVVACLLVLVQLRLLRQVPVAEASGSGHGLPQLRSPFLGWGALWVWSLLGFTTLLPCGVLAAYSLPLSTYVDVWTESVDAFANTFLTVGLAMLLTVGLAVGYGWSTRRRTPLLLDLLLTVPYALPASLIAVALIQILNRPGWLGALYDTLFPAVWAYLVLFFPFAHKTLQPAWEQIDPRWVDEAVLLGASPWQQFGVAAWPVVRPYIAAAAAVVGILAAREIDATALLAIPGGETVAFRVYDYLHFAPGPKVAALSVILVGVGAVLLSALLGWARQSEEK